ncbi:MAG: acyl-CoA synthetase [Chloroflexota bacterium]
MAEVRTVADIEAIEAVPLMEQGVPENTYELFSQCAEKFGDKEALVFFLQGTDYQNAVRFSYRDLLAKVNQTANMLNGLGVGPTDTVSYILPNLPQTYFTLYGGEAAGIANPINPLLEPHVLAEIMNAAKTKVLVTLAPFPKSDVWEKVASIVNDVPTLETILRIDIGGYLSGVKKLVVNLIRLGKGREPVRAKVLDFDKTLAQYPTGQLTSNRKIQPDDVAAYFHTGGTTGTPKLALHTHFNQTFDGWAAGEVIDLGTSDISYLGLPLFHNYGAIAIGLANWTVGANIIMGTPQGYRGEGVVDNLWKILDHYNCTSFSSVPTLISTMLNVPIGDADLSKLKYSTSGAAPLPVETANQFTERTGIELLEGYGLTESTSVASVNPKLGEKRIGSVGLRLPYQEMRTAIVNGDQFERFCEVDEVGAIIINGPNVFPGYKEAFQNDGLFVEAEGKKWVNTGDLGRMDAEGYFWLTGRKKELIIRGGHNIDPKQIEEPMHEHPAVALAAAVGRPDARVGELPVVYVELKPDASATTDELMTFAQEHIGERAAVPKEIIILDEIPQTAVGKIFKPTLTFEQVTQVFNEDLAKVDGIANCHVDVHGDKRLGTVANVSVNCGSGADKTAVEAKVKEVLGRYSVHSNIEVN